jgi:hypothetical protein
MSISTRRRRVVLGVGSKGVMARSTSVFLVVFLLAVALALAAGVAGARGGVAATEATSGAVKDMSAPVTACPDKPPAKCKPKAPGKGSGTGPTNIGGAIAEALAKMATDQLGGFVLSQLGLSELLDPNTKRFDELQAQLEGISSQIATLEHSVNQISSELKEIKANQFIIPLDGYVTAVQEYYDDDFKPMLNELEDYAAAERAAVAAGSTCDQSEACKQSRQNFNDDRTTFLAHAAMHLGDNRQIHRLLVPGSTGGSALKAFGEYLIGGGGSTGFLTAADSNRVFTLYHYFAEYEALATWMKGQYQAVNFQNQPTNFANFVDLEVTGFQRDESDELPARIPPGTVISLPVNTVDRTTTLNRPMWIWDWTVEAGLTWDPGKPPTQLRSVPAALTILNTTKAGGDFHDWRVPSRSDFAGLFAGQSTRFPKDNAAEFLDRILPNDSLERLLRLENFGSPYLWTSDAAGTEGDVTCALSSSDRVTVGGYAHTGIFFGNKLTADPNKFPLLYVPALVMPLTLNPVTISPPGGGLTRDQRIQWCKDEAARQVTAAIEHGADYLYRKSAHLVATRSTGTQKFMP